MAASGGVLGLLALGIFGAGALILGMGDDGDAPQAPTPQGVPPQAAPMPPAMSCEQALARVRDLDPALHAGVAMALSMTSDTTALRNLAIKLQQLAGAPALPASARPAVLKLAACVRDRAAAIEAAQASKPIVNPMYQAPLGG